MSTQTSIKCDCCGEELAIDSSYPANWGIKVSSHNYGINTTGVMYGVAMLPSLKTSLDFCGLACLKQWINK